MSIPSRISAIYDLGQFFSFITENETDKDSNHSKFKYLQDEFFAKLKLAEIHNPWFTQDNLKFCLEQWGKILTKENLNNWVKDYSETQNSKGVGIIMAGNIPLVGFHDLISVLLSGHHAIVKTSSKDDILMSFVIDYLLEFDALKNTIQKVERLKNHDAVIATGSNNTARYFEFYFKEIPHIIRKNRTSLAVLNGNETEQDLKKLSEDIFRYFGLGCRNVTKIYLPKGFNTDKIFESFFDWSHIINHTKYSNNYDYNRAIYLMGSEDFLDNNFVVLKKSEELFSPIGVINYEFYEDLNEVKNELIQNEEKIQCVVGNNFEIKFGDTQKPSLTDYADGVDVMKFLESL
ncbi:acyl-CoA reductase [Moheibacter sediminis]|uniref:Acyl-CoA reductase (LuxC) n=1 Tax=Moheibacter sediminis TaxID=1434700 RepID=A0A1W2BU18_9FLAO|nr:acyl-CoA reductase [Moheibacter sediminis]SMC76224.1 Acyl-CoA reductase (LuxC) [Moheibacter sediminis]